jgi:hypothetical protein
MQPPAAPVLSLRRPHAWILAGWAVLLSAGLAAMAIRDHRPGERGAVPASWPQESRLVRDRDGLTLLMFAHPHCPCTVASLRELERILARSSDRLHAQVVFCVPDGAPAGWERTDLWEQACAIPGVSVVADPRGFESRLFGACTSGTTLVYDARGGLQFEGGITGERGHEGDNAGKSAVLACLETPRAETFTVPVFGCPLFETERKP